MVLLPAAGASRRMRGRDKLLEEVRGQPLLADRVAAALTLGGEVMVTLPAGAVARRGALAPLAGPRLRLEEVPEASEGMAASLRRGAARARALGAAGLMILLPDLPDLTARDLATVARAGDGTSIFRATAADGTPGHPVIIPARLLSELERLRGDTGARALIAAHRVRHVALPGRRAVTDLDTPEAWAEWRARQPKNVKKT